MKNLFVYIIIPMLSFINLCSAADATILRGNGEQRLYRLCEFQDNAVKTLQSLSGASSCDDAAASRRYEVYIATLAREIQEIIENLQPGRLAIVLSVCKRFLSDSQLVDLGITVSPQTNYPTPSPADVRVLRIRSGFARGVLVSTRVGSPLAALESGSPARVSLGLIGNDSDSDSEDDSSDEEVLEGGHPAPLLEVGLGAAPAAAAGAGHSVAATLVAPARTVLFEDCFLARPCAQAEIVEEENLPAAAGGSAPQDSGQDIRRGVSDGQKTDSTVFADLMSGRLASLGVGLKPYDAGTPQVHSLPASAALAGAELVQKEDPAEPSAQD